MYLGIDTSNYTTSIATLDNKLVHYKKMLCVKEGERGLRQSDAVFQHTVNLPALIESAEIENIEAVGVSTKPRNVDASYMPCFLAGDGVARAIAKVNNASLYKTSHQVGHILAVLYDTKKLDLINDKFIAFHLSGGTTEALLVKPSKDEIIKAEIISQSLDLKAGQAIDRAGVMMGLQFPCGKELDRLSKNCTQKFKFKPSMKGVDCSLSGIENKSKKMLDEGYSMEDISKFVLTAVSTSVDKMIEELIKEYGSLPIVFSGGVSSNSMLRDVVLSKYNAYFAKPDFSLDNAGGVAVYAKLKHN